MTTDEVQKLLAVVAARYPNSKVWDQEPDLTVSAWHMSLDDVPFADAQRVLVGWFKTRKWAPDPSEIRGLLVDAAYPIPPEGDAWREGLAWVRGAQDAGEFGIVVMHSLGSRRDVGQMDMDKLREAFGHAYRRMAEEERNWRAETIGKRLTEAALPTGLRAIS